MHRTLFLLFALSIHSQVNAQELDELTWPLARGNDQSQAYSPSKLPSQPSLLWEYKVESTAFESTPVIVNGFVFLGDLDGEFYCLEAGTGKLVWKHESESGYLAGAAVHGSSVIVGDYDGLVRCFQAADGKELWQFQTDSQIDGGANFHGNLALIASEDGNLYALEIETGKLAWSYETGDQLRCSPTVAGNKTFLGGCDGKLHIVDLISGTSIGDGVPLNGPTGSTPTAIGNLIIAPTHSGDVFGIDWQSSQVRWTFSDDQRSQEIQSSPAYFEQVVYIVTKNRKCLALNVTDGTLKWEYTLLKASDASPVVCDGRVWLCGSDGRLLALDAKTGKEVWVAEHQGKFKSSAAIADGKLILASDRGSVFCYGEPKK